MTAQIQKGKTETEKLVSEKIVDSELQLVVFEVGKEEFGVEIMKVQEIIRMTSIMKIPQAPSFVRGIINLRGKIIVVIDLNEILGMEKTEQNENTRIVVTDLGGLVVGFVVDSVSEVIRLLEKNIEPAPAIIVNKINTDYVRGVGKMDNRLLILPALEMVLSMDELRNVRNISTENEKIVM